MDWNIKVGAYNILDGNWLTSQPHKMHLRSLYSLVGNSYHARKFYSTFNLVTTQDGMTDLLFQMFRAIFIQSSVTSQCRQMSYDLQLIKQSFTVTTNY